MICRAGGWAQQMRDMVGAFRRRHPAAKPEKGREGLLSAARERLPSDVKLLGLRMLQQSLGVAEGS